MPSSQFDSPQIENHRTARFKFIPWLARFLGEGPIRADAPALPVGDEEALTDETVEILQGIANAACWKFLVQECGWQKIDSVKVSNKDGHSIRRIWEEEAVELPALHFTTATPDLLLTVFNATRKSESVDVIRMPDCLQSNGDLLLHHLIFRKLHSNPKSFGLEYNHPWLQWYPNPLNALLDPPKYGGKNRVTIDWTCLTSPELVPFLPWISSYYAERWRSESEGFWANGLEDRLAWLGGLTFLISNWLESVEQIEREDLANFVIDLLIHHIVDGQANLETFNELNSGKPMSFRQEKAEIWTEFLELASQLEDKACECFDIHPVERTGAQKCFLAKWESTDFKDTIEEIRLLSQSLRPSFN